MADPNKIILFVNYCTSLLIVNNTEMLNSVSDILDIKVIFSDLSKQTVCKSPWSGIMGQKEAKVGSA